MLIMILGQLPHPGKYSLDDCSRTIVPPDKMPPGRLPHIKRTYTYSKKGTLFTRASFVFEVRSISLRRRQTSSCIHLVPVIKCKNGINTLRELFFYGNLFLPCAHWDFFTVLNFADLRIFDSTNLFLYELHNCSFSHFKNFAV